MCKDCIGISKQQVIAKHQPYIELSDDDRLRFTREAYHHMSAEDMSELQKHDHPQVIHSGYAIIELMKRIESLEREML